MKLIVGLGNPGSKYENTRHNIGFVILDLIAQRANVNISTDKHKGLFVKTKINGEDVILLKPQTFMNNSGESVRLIADYYNIKAEDIIVIYDDVEFEPGKIKVRPQGSAGGQNGMKSIIKYLGTEKFPRIRVGVGRPRVGMDLADFVLSKFSKPEAKYMEEAIINSISAAEDFISNMSLDDLMAKYN